MQQPGIFKSMKVLHLAMLSGQAIFLLILLYLKNGGVIENVATLSPDTEKQMNLFWSIGGIFILLAANVIYRRKVSSIALSDLPVSEKLAQYRSANILRWAFMESIVLLSLIFYFLTGTNNYAIVGGMLIIVFFFLRPLKSKAALELRLQEDELMSE